MACWRVRGNGASAAGSLFRAYSIDSRYSVAFAYLVPDHLEIFLTLQRALHDGGDDTGYVSCKAHPETVLVPFGFHLSSIRSTGLRWSSALAPTYSGFHRPS